jgi:hypothetical protein
MSDALIRVLAVTFALQPGMAARLLAEHVDDGTGRCRVCTAGQSARERWPCKIHWYTSRAMALHEESLRDRRDGFAGVGEHGPDMTVRLKL